MQANVGRIKGSMWYTGTDIEGHSTTPTVYETDIDYARVDDLYLNTSNGNVFACVTPGDPDTAEWVYNCNIAGPTPDLVDNLHTDSATKALTARQGKVLNDKILSSGIFPDNVDIDVSDTAYMAQITIRNIDGTLTFTTESGTGTYTFTKIGTADTYTVTVDIGEDIGLAEEGAVVTNIAFDDNIYSITLKDDNADTIYSEEYKVWDGLNNALAQVKPGAYITDGTNTIRTGFIQKAINGLRNLIYPVTNAKAVFMDFARTTTVYDALDDVQDDIDVVSTRTQNFAPIEDTNIASQTYTTGQYLVYNGLLYKVTSAIAQGATLQVGVNIEQTKVGDELYRLDKKGEVGDLITSSQINLTQNVSTEIYRASQKCRVYVSVSNLSYFSFNLNDDVLIEPDPNYGIPQIKSYPHRVIENVIAWNIKPIFGNYQFSIDMEENDILYGAQGNYSAGATQGTVSYQVYELS